MTTLSTSAWILHDLGMAAGFGGTLFGKAALDPAVKGIGSREERGRVLDEAWGRYRVLDAVALGAMAATWLAGRRKFSGKALGRPMRTLVLAKDVLVGGAVITGIASLVGGAVLHRKRRLHGEAPMSSGRELASGTPPDIAKAVRFLGVLGPINAAFVAGGIAVNAALAQASGKSARWTLASRFLP